MKKSTFEMTAEDTESAEDLLVKNMEYAAVIRALRANAREDAATIDQLQRERDELRATIEDAKKALSATDFEGILLASLRVKEERDEARKNLRILAGLVAYGLSQSGEAWSLEAMRQATAAIQNAKKI